MKICRKSAMLPSNLIDYVMNMSAAECDELRVLIYVLSKDGEIETDEIALALGLSDTEVISAVSFWRGAGLISASGKGKKKAVKPKDEETKTMGDEKAEKQLPPSVRDTDTRTYTGEEIAEILEKKPELLSLLDFAQHKLGRTFSPSDIAKLVYLEDYVLLSAPMIMRIIEYCVELDKKSMRYIEKTALAIYDDGICDYNSLEVYLEKKRAARSAQGIVRRIIGIGERSFTSREKEYIDRWFDEFGASEELITLAYEKTIANIAKPSLAYMNKLLEVWHGKGYKTVDDVNSGAQNSDVKGKIDLGMFDEASSNSGGKTGSADALDLESFFENP